MSTDVSINRRKFVLCRADGVELRVEQISPHEWGGSIYRKLVIEASGVLTTHHLWDVFTTIGERGEQVAKDSAIAGVQDLPPDQGNWLNCSDDTEEAWRRSLADRGFSKYPPRDGMERWPGF